MNANENGSISSKGHNQLNSSVILFLDAKKTYIGNDVLWVNETEADILTESYTAEALGRD